MTMKNEAKGGQMKRIITIAVTMLAVAGMGLLSSCSTNGPSTKSGLTKETLVKKFQEEMIKAKPGSVGTWP